MTTLDSRIILCKGINLDKDYVNVLNINDANMLTLCNSKAVYTTSNMQFLSPLKKVRVDCPYSTCFQCNYLALQNPSYGAKWYFAFITEINYISDKVTEISFEVDEWTTWFSYLGLKDCYVIREHVSNDTIGLHTIPENLDTGEIITLKYQEDKGYSSIKWIAVLTDYDITKTGDSARFQGITVFNGNVFGHQLFLIQINNINDYINLLGLILKTNKEGHIDDIKEIFVIPYNLLTPRNLQQVTWEVSGETFTAYTTRNSSTAKTFESTLLSPYTWEDFIPKNNKCYVYPYNFCQISNNSGNVNNYQFELFYNNEIKFQNELAFGVGVSGRIAPKNYKGIEINYDESLSLSKYPSCGWSSSGYDKWLTQNSVNNYVGFLNLLGDIGENLGGIDNKIESGTTISSGILQYYDRFRQAKLLPNIQGGSNNGDVINATNTNTFVIKHQRCKLEYLKIIDNYFSRYGYKVLELKTPNISSRAHWNYIQIR